MVISALFITFVLDNIYLQKLLPFDKKWSDFRMCAWSSSYLFPERTSQDLIQPSTISSTSTDLAQFFARMNDPFLATANKKSRISDSDSPDQKDEVVVTYSHFLPRQELCPEKIFLLEPHMTKVIGSNYLEQQIRQIEPQLHIVSIPFAYHQLSLTSPHIVWSYTYPNGN